MLLESDKGHLEAMLRLLMIFSLSTAFGMPSIPDELFHASEHIAEIVSYVEVSFSLSTFKAL